MVGEILIKWTHIYHIFISFFFFSFSMKIQNLDILSKKMAKIHGFFFIIFAAKIQFSHFKIQMHKLASHTCIMKTNIKYYIV